MKVLLNNVSENRAAWLALRQSTIGSSEIAAISGLSRWSSPLQMWMQKTGRCPSTEENADMRLGNLLEPFIGSEFARAENRKLEKADVLVGHETLEGLTASPDFWEYEPDGDINGIVEIKNVTSRMVSNWDDNQTPDDYIVQLQWQLGMTGKQRGSVVAMLGGSARNIVERPFAFDPKFFDQLVCKAQSFLEMVKSDTPPAPNHLDRALIESTLDPQPDSKIVLSDEFIPMFSEYHEIVVARKLKDKESENLKKLEDSFRARIEQKAQPETEEIICGDFKVKLNRINKKGHFVSGSSYVTCTLYNNGTKV